MLPANDLSRCDVLIVGGGPAGATCAAFCARAGLAVTVAERAVFPRDKVCGDCLNPAAWPTLERLGIESAVRALPHVRLRAVEFENLRGRMISLPLPDGGRGEIAVRRREFDALLLKSAAAAGAEVREGIAVAQVERDSAGWKVLLVSDSAKSASTWLRARVLVAADGRNSLVARGVNLAQDGGGWAASGIGARGRIGLQAHIPCPADFGPKVRMKWFANGYGGLCPVGGGLLNVSLAAPPGALAGLKDWARAEFSLPADFPWRTIAPVDRAPARRAAGADGSVYLVGDAARVVEPFTGEGIYYALRSGELAAAAIVSGAGAGRGSARAEAAARYRKEHAAMYRGRLWVNRLAGMAGRHPRLAAAVLEVLRIRPQWLGLLTAKVVGPGG